MDSEIPTPSVKNRFVSEAVIEGEKQTREEEWASMTAKLLAEGKAVPEKALEEGQVGYDGRSLWEKLQEHKDKKQEVFDEQIKFKNQFRALDEDEISFLDSLVDDNFEEEDKKREIIKNELDGFRRAVIERAQLPPPPPISNTITSLNSIASTSALPSPIATVREKVIPTKKASNKKRDFQKSFLKGVIVKKKEKPSSATSIPSPSSISTPTTASSTPAAKLTASEQESLDGKRRKLDTAVKEP